MAQMFDTLCLSNLEHFAKAIEEKLRGRRYTFVAVNEGFAWESMTEVRTGQSLDATPVNIWYDKENDPPRHGGFNFGDSHGVWGVSTNQQGDRPRYDPEFNNPYIVIDYHQVKIVHRAPAGHRLTWVIALEPDREA